MSDKIEPRQVLSVMETFPGIPESDAIAFLKIANKRGRDWQAGDCYPLRNETTDPESGATAVTWTYYDSQKSVVADAEMWCHKHGGSMWFGKTAVYEIPRPDRPTGKGSRKRGTGEISKPQVTIIDGVRLMPGDVMVVTQLHDSFSTQSYSGQYKLVKETLSTTLAGHELHEAISEVIGQWPSTTGIGIVRHSEACDERFWPSRRELAEKRARRNAVGKRFPMASGGGSDMQAEPPEPDVPPQYTGPDPVDVAATQATAEDAAARAARNRHALGRDDSESLIA